MEKHIKKFVREAGVLSLSLTVAFVIFLGVMVAQGVFTEPTTSPTGGNPAPPLDTSTAFQRKPAPLRVEELYIDNWFFGGRPLSSLFEGKEHYSLTTVAGFKNQTVPLDMAAVRRLCADEYGCRITLGMRDWAPRSSPPTAADRPGLTASRGPYAFFMATSTVLNEFWWRTAPQGEDPTIPLIGVVDAFDRCRPDPTPPPGDVYCAVETSFGDNQLTGDPTPRPLWQLKAIFYGAEGRDNNGTVDHILRAWDCYITDGEYVASPSDIQVQFGLLNWGGGATATNFGSLYPSRPTYCVLDIED